MSILNPIQRFFRRRAAMVSEIDQLRRENDQLRAKLAAAHHAKEQAENQANERRREKDVLRNRIGDQKKSVEDTQRMNEQLTKKVAELRAEIDHLQRRKKAK